ncbi:MAG: hypothetical protein U0903_12275 [Planctomycetales bacterium]
MTSLSKSFLALAAGLLVSLLVVGCKGPAVEVTVTVKQAEGEKAAGKEGDKEAADAAPAGFGDLNGVVTVDGDVAAAPLVVKKGDAAVKDAAVCAAEDVPDDSLAVDPKTKGLSSVFVFLAKPPKNINPDLKKDEAKEVIFDQKTCRFIPHALLVQTDQVVLVKSDDAVSHNTHTFSTRNPQINTSISPNDRKGVVFKVPKPESRPFEVKCDVHPWMKAYWLTIDHPYGAVTDAQGKFSIKGLPAGNHEFVVWHERGNVLERAYKVTIKPGAAQEVALKVPAAKLK